MDRFDAMRLFVRVVETGSFSAVAREANIGQPAVSKQIAALEEHLGAQLLHRTSRNLNLTEAGQVYYETVVRLLADLEDTEQAVGRGQTQPSGLLRISLSAGFGRLVVVPLLPSFHARYPEIVTDLIVSDRFVDLVEDGVDVAIRLGELDDSSVIARRIGVSPRVTVATPAYLARTGAPKTPHDLDRHACIAFTFRRRPQDWVFLGQDGPIRHTPKGPMRANDAENIRHYFEQLFSIDDGARRYKPAPEAYRSVADSLMVAPSELCLVACHTWDTMGAAAAGWTTALLARDGNAALDIGRQPDITGSDLSIVADALISR